MMTPMRMTRMGLPVAGVAVALCLGAAACGLPAAAAPDSGTVAAEAATGSVAAEAATGNVAVETATGSVAAETKPGGADIDSGQRRIANLAFAGGEGAVVLGSVRAANSLTAFGLHVSPRYMTSVGDLDAAVLGGYVNLPSTTGGLAGAQISLQARLTPDVVALADMGPVTSLGLRGPLWSGPAAAVGWDVRYRSEIYFAAQPGFGLSSPGFGLMPGFPGGSSQGAEFALDGSYDWNSIRVYSSPFAAAMTNRNSAGLVAGADYELGPLTVGYGATVQSNFLNPVSGAAIQPLEVRHSAGLRWAIADWLYLQANFHFLPGDTYGIPSQTLLAGVGTRLLGSFEAGPPEGAIAQAGSGEAGDPLDPADLLGPGDPGLPGASDKAASVSVKGRVLDSSQPGGNPGRPLTVGLKVLTRKGWTNVPETARTDAAGNYVFHGLPGGRYQVVYRDEGLLPGGAGAAVSEDVAIRPHRPAVADLDVAWNAASISATRTGNRVEVSWPAKPGAPDAVFEVILKYAPDDSVVLVSPQTSRSRTTIEIPGEIRGRKLCYTVKYWKRGGQFQGANYYGQSTYKVLEESK